MIIISKYQDFKSYLKTTIFWFSILFIIGYSIEFFSHDFSTGLITILNNKMNKTPFTFSEVFSNNFGISFLDCFTPLSIISLFSNSLILGVFSHHIIQTKGLLFLIIGILPHGIFELPATFISIASGLRILEYFIIGLNPTDDKEKIRNFLIKDTIKIMVLVYVLLFIAALIEVNITPIILNKVQ